MTNHRSRFKTTIVSRLAVLAIGTFSLNAGVALSPAENSKVRAGFEESSPCVTERKASFWENIEDKLTFNFINIENGFGVNQGSVPWLRTQGKWLVNEKGQQVKLRGVSLCNYHQKYGGYAKRISEVTARQNGWYANVVRLPAYPGAIKRHGLENFVETYLDPAIEKCVEKGIYCIIDYHPVDRDWDAPNNKNHIIAREFWKHTAPKYQNIPNVMYEVYNEPCRPRSRSLQEWLKWRRLAQPWVDLIRARAPNNIVIVGSPACSSNPVHANTHPFQGNNLVYTYHAYPTQRTLRIMEKHIGAYKGERIPLFLTEFGWQPNGHHVHGGTTSGWGQTLKQFLEKRPYINWTAWAYSPTCGPSMLDENWHLKGGEHMGQAIKGWIAEENK